MTKPPVKLGVGKKFLEKRKEPPSDRMKLVWQPQHFNIGGSMSMNDVKSLSHSKWRCKYHIVFAPKYRRQIIYGRIKADAVAHAISETQDPQLESALVVSQGKLNQAQLEDYQSDALDLYKAKEPKGNIISIRPNDDTSTLIITADSVQKDTVKAFKKKFKNNVVVQLPQPETVKADAAIQFPLPPRVNYYDTTNK